MTKTRTWYLDYIRIIATVAVIMLHVSSYHFYSPKVTSSEWAALNVYDSIVRYAVPVFLMLSGALFLNPEKEIDLKKLYGKYILRMVTAFIFWSLLYAVVTNYNKGLKEVVVAFIKGHFHMWYLFLIVSMYMIVPFLKKITASMELTKYFLILGLIFTFLIPEVISLLKASSDGAFVAVGNAANTALGNMNFNFAAGFVLYFVGGWYLSQAELGKKARIFVYVLGIAGFAATILISYYLSLKKGTPVETYFKHFKINVLLETVFVFVFAKYELSKIKLGKCGQKIVMVLSKYSFGVYLVHVLVRNILAKTFGFSAMTFHPAAAVPVVTVVIFAVSLGISWVLNQIPVVKKYLV